MFGILFFKYSNYLGIRNTIIIKYSNIYFEYFFFNYPEYVLEILFEQYLIQVCVRVPSTYAFLAVNNNLVSNLYVTMKYNNDVIIISNIYTIYMLYAFLVTILQSYE